jgi:hypothetical protein
MRLVLDDNGHSATNSNLYHQRQHLPTHPHHTPFCEQW